MIPPTFGSAERGATSPAGLLLAAGAGSRMGTPKSLVNGWLERGVDALAAAGCSPVVVVLGAAAQQARAVMQGLDVVIAVAADWSDGLSVSLRTGIAALPDDVPAVVVTLIDLPDVGQNAVRRVVTHGATPATLARATYHGRPGHPVVLGRAHWAGILDAANGDVGARAYLDQHPPTLVECGDLASGRDIDWSSESILSGGISSQVSRA